jgi:hypothetical protein
MVDAIGGALPGFDAPVRRFLLNVKRRCFNGREIGAGLPRAGGMGLPPRFGFAEAPQREVSLVRLDPSSSRSSLLVARHPAAREGNLAAWNDSMDRAATASCPIARLQTGEIVARCPSWAPVRPPPR